MFMVHIPFHLGEFLIGSYLKVKDSTKSLVTFLVLVRGNFFISRDLPRLKSSSVNDPKPKKIVSVKALKGNMHHKHDVSSKDVFSITDMAAGIFF